MRIRSAISTLAVMLMLTACSSFADSFIYGNNATYGSPYIYKIDKTTGAVVNTYTGLSSNNGRGVVVVGNTMYYTAASSGSVYSYNLSTSTDNGVLFTVAGATGLSTIAFDGTNFWIGDYSGTNQAFLYSTTGTLLNTITLDNCGGYCDGLEYLAANGGELLSNRDDAGGPYDLYDTSGNLLTASFIDPGQSCSGPTGVAFDGTNFFVSCIYSGTLMKFDADGNYVSTMDVTGAPNGYSPLIEDLSADYEQVLPPPSDVPEPSSFLMFGSGIVGLLGVGRDRLARILRR